jgi:hypothetical protein
MSDPDLREDKVFESDTSSEKTRLYVAPSNPIRLFAAAGVVTSIIPGNPEMKGT